ncbi:MAG: hypothetical protein KF763_16590 [Cyclobacteriaceae bacterium]|nr:hypothetical protein [Cyclobacteriaceae bacterium]
MIKRLTIAIILFSMVLHSASRLGVLSYVVANKASIAYSLGLLNEPPITSCSQDFYFADRFTISAVAEEKNVARLPVAIEIQLFFVETLTIKENTHTELKITPTPVQVFPFCDGVKNSVFRPPIFS